MHSSINLFSAKYVEHAIILHSQCFNSKGTAIQHIAAILNQITQHASAVPRKMIENSIFPNRVNFSAKYFQLWKCNPICAMRLAPCMQASAHAMCYTFFRQNIKNHAIDYAATARILWVPKRNPVSCVLMLHKLIYCGWIAVCHIHHFAIMAFGSICVLYSINPKSV